MINDVHSAEIWPTTTSVGEIVYPPGSSLGPRIQPYVQLVFVHRGEMTVWIDDVPHAAPENSASILLPNHREHFVFSAAGETHHSWLHLEVEKLPPILQARIERLPWPLPISPALSQLMHDALKVRHASIPTREQLLKVMGLHMLWCYIGEGEQQLQKTQASYHPAIEQAQQYIYQHLQDGLALEGIANAAAVSPSQLIRLFRAHLKTTPMAFTWQCRINKGIELLEQTGLGVGTIAERCGFQSRYHFTRRIREATGHTPLEVRRRSWQRVPH